jgi:hypothetical protein
MMSWTALLVVALGPTERPAERVVVTHPKLLYVRESGAEACPTAAELRELVSARLGYDPFDDAGDMSLLVRASRDEHGLVGTVELIDAMGQPRGQREIVTQGEGCAELAQALSLSMSIAIDPERALQAAQPPVALPVAPEAASPSTTAPPGEPKSASGPGPAAPLGPVSAKGAPLYLVRDRASPRGDGARGARLQLTVAALTLLGVAPNPAFGGSLTAQGRRGAWSLGAGARFARSASAPVDGSADLAATFAAGEANGCFQHAPFEHCTALLLGATWIWSNRVTAPRADVGVFGALAWRSGVVAAISQRFDLVAQVEGSLVLSPIHPQVNDRDVWYAPRVVGGLAAGARAHF